MLILILPVIAYSCNWLPTYAGSADDPTIGYGQNEKDRHFVAVALLYITHKLVPLVVLVCERIAAQKHRSRLAQKPVQVQEQELGDVRLCNSDEL